MDKIFVDRTILEFQTIFFGFALTKTTDNLIIDETAKRLNLSIGTIKWHLHNARNQIKEGIVLLVFFFFA